VSTSLSLRQLFAHLDPHLRPPYQWRGVVSEVHDGDTLTVVVDRGLDDYSELRVRLLGCNARELAQPGGPEAAANLKAMLPPGTVVVVTSDQWDKYGGRVLGQIEFAQLGELYDLATELVRLGWAAAWDGQGSKRVPVWPRKPAPVST
jgi:endonuclease YncB( thermonuclease family)